MAKSPKTPAPAKPSTPKPPVWASVIIGLLILIFVGFGSLGGYILLTRGKATPTPRPSVAAQVQTVVVTAPPIVITATPAPPAAPIVITATPGPTSTPIIITATPAQSVAPPPTATSAATTSTTSSSTTAPTVVAASQATPTDTLHQCGETITTPTASLKITCQADGGWVTLHLHYTNLETGRQTVNLTTDGIQGQADDGTALFIHYHYTEPRILLPNEAVDKDVIFDMPTQDMNVVVNLTWGHVTNVKLGFTWANGKVLPYP